MKHNKHPILISLILTVAIVLAGFGVRAVRAEEYVELTGQVAAVDETAGTLTLEVEEDGSTTSYTVFLPDDFDFDRIAVGDIVEVEGTLNTSGEIELSDLDVEGEEESEYTGEVTAIDNTAGTLTMEVEEDGSTTSYTVLLPDDFDYDRIEVGDTVEVEGPLNASGEIELSDLDVEDDEEEVELTGEVTAIDEAAGTLTLEVEEDGSTTSYTVLLPDDFDYDRIEVGDTVEVEGTLNDAGEILLGNLDVEDDEEDEEEGKESSSYCENLDAPHPAGASIADTYGVDYEQVMEWFCEDNLGFGEVKHLLRTSEQTETSLEEILSMRLDGMGWG